MTNTTKEFRISSGIGLGSAVENASKAGLNFWIQFDYGLAKHFSIGMESDFINFKQNGIYANIPVSPNEMNMYSDNFSLLIKYHLLPLHKFKINLATGWTYNITQTAYYNFYSAGTQVEWFPETSSTSDYRIPFIVEFAYPIYEQLDLITRLKYNMHGQNDDTYSGGIGLSLKL